MSESINEEIQNNTETWCSTIAETKPLKGHVFYIYIDNLLYMISTYGGYRNEIEYINTHLSTHEDLLVHFINKCKSAGYSI